MKLRSLEEIETQERDMAEDRRVSLLMPPERRKPLTYDLRPGPVKAVLLAFGDFLLFLPRLVIKLLDAGLAIAIVLGLVGCIIFGLVYLFG